MEISFLFESGGIGIDPASRIRPRREDGLFGEKGVKDGDDIVEEGMLRDEKSGNRGNGEDLYPKRDDRIVGFAIG